MMTCVPRVSCYGQLHAAGVWLWPTSSHAAAALGAGPRWHSRYHVGQFQACPGTCRAFPPHPTPRPLIMAAHTPHACASSICAPPHGVQKHTPPDAPHEPHIPYAHSDPNKSPVLGCGLMYNAPPLRQRMQPTVPTTSVWLRPRLHRQPRGSKRASGTSLARACSSRRRRPPGSQAS